MEKDAEMFLLSDCYLKDKEVVSLPDNVIDALDVGINQ